MLLLPFLSSSSQKAPMALESSRTAPYVAPQLIPSRRLLANKDISMNNTTAGAFAFPTNTQQNQFFDGVQGYDGGCGKKRPCHHMDNLFGINVSQQLNQLQADSDLLVAHHIKRIKLETELQLKREMRLIVAAFHQKAIVKIKESESKLEQVNQMYAALHEKAVALSMENELWRNLAKENEETANTLRENLVQIITQATVTSEEVAPEEDGCNSFCGSNDCGGGNLEGDKQEVDMVPTAAVVPDSAGGCGGGCSMCFSCKRMESCVLLLPCKHLCLCQFCGVTLPTACRVCGTECNGSIRVNLC